MHGKTRSFFESLVIIAIVLVLVQTFLEDLAVVLGWTWDVRRALITAGFGFDLFFTLEFLIRFFAALEKGEAREYFLHRKGWIDFFASLPLLLFNSGPVILALALGGGAAAGLGGVFNILKVAKAVRVARILRLLRVLKIFKQIKHTDSVMAQRHVSLIITLTVSITVLTLFGAGFVRQFFTGEPGVSELYERTEKAVLEQIRNSDGFSLTEKAETAPSILIVKKDGRTLYTRYDNAYYREHFGPMDYRYAEGGEYAFYLSNTALSRDQAGENLTFFVLIVFMVLGVLLYYGPHFALTVSDPIHVMRRGFEEKNYTLEVKVPERFAKDGVFKLAEAYNREYLPLKERQKEEEESLHSDLSIDAVGDFFK
jgi:hypothetical protein